MNRQKLSLQQSVEGGSSRRSRDLVEKKEFLKSRKTEKDEGLKKPGKRCVDENERGIAKETLLRVLMGVEARQRSTVHGPSCGEKEGEKLWREKVTLLNLKGGEVLGPEASLVLARGSS